MTLTSAFSSEGVIKIDIISLKPVAQILEGLYLSHHPRQWCRTIPCVGLSLNVQPAFSFLFSSLLFLLLFFAFEDRGLSKKFRLNQALM